MRTAEENSNVFNIYGNTVKLTISGDAAGPTKFDVAA